MHETYQTAGFRTRFGALFLDAILFIPFFFLTEKLLGKSSAEIIMSIAWLSYNILFLWRQGATIGKKLFSVRVVTVDGQHLGLGRVLLRETVGRIASGILNLGYIWVVADKKNQGFHDKIAGTLVLRVDKTGNFIPRTTPPSGSWLLFFLAFVLFIGLPILGLVVALLSFPLRSTF